MHIRGNARTATARRRRQGDAGPAAPGSGTLTTAERPRQDPTSGPAGPFCVCPGTTGQQSSGLGLRSTLPAGDSRSGWRAAAALPHTEIDPSVGGRGLGTALVAGVLDAARERGLHVLPYCSFVRHYIQQHAELVDLVAEEDRPHFGLATADR